MKLLILTSRFPYPLEKGDKLRLYHQLRELARHCEIVLCALSEHPVETEHLDALRPFCSRIEVFQRSKLTVVKNLFLAVFSGLPFQVAWFFDEKIKQRFEQVVAEERPDHLYCQLIRTAPYARDVSVPKTLDYMDNFSRWSTKLASHQRWPWSKWLLQWEARKVAAYEAAVFQNFDHHTIISQQDRDALTFPEKTAIHCIPNGVDTAFFRPMPAVEKSYDVAFVGNLGYYNNVEAAKFIAQLVVPLVLEKRPDCRFLIAGARPVAEVKRLENEQVTVFGWLDDIRDAYARSRVFVAPIFLAVGLQNKILEAMAMGLPCVTTQQVNNAIGARPGESVLIAASAEEFASQIIFLLENDKRRSQMSDLAAAFVTENFSWQSAVTRLRNFMEENRPNK